MIQFIQTIKRNRTFKAIKKQLQKEKAERRKFEINNSHDDLSDLADIERLLISKWKYQCVCMMTVKSANFYVDHFRKVKEARLSIK